MLDKELRTLSTQKQKYFTLYESDSIDNDFLIERLNDLKSRHDALSKGKSEAERQFAQSTADPTPLDQVRQALSQFHKMLAVSPVETQKSLLQTLAKQIHVKKGQKIEGIELEFYENVNAYF